MYKVKPYKTIVIFIVGLSLAWLFLSKMQVFETAKNPIGYEVFAYLQGSNYKTIKEVSSINFAKELVYLSKDQQIMHVPNAIYWIKLVLEQRDKHKNYILVAGTAYNFIEVYIRNGNSYQRLSPNNLNKFLGINISTEKPYFVLPQDVDKEIFVKISNTFATGIGFEIITLNNYYNSITSIYSLYAFYLGGMLFLMAYIIIFYIKSNEKTYLTYFIYLVSMTIFSLFHWKFFDSYMSSLFYLNFWHTTSYSLITLSILVYSLTFYKDQLKDSNYQELLRAALGVKIIFWLLAIYTNQYWINDRWIDLTLLLPVIVFSFKHFRHNTSSVWYFGFGMIMIYIGMIVMIFPRFNDSFNDNNLFFITSLTQIYLFFFSIADKYAILKIEKENALTIALDTQLSLNTQLESGIQKAKNELRAAYLEIERINSLLKNDNQKLQKNLKDHAIQRFENQLLSYEEFNNLFPDENTCQKYIADMKWTKRPLCSKCGKNSFYKLSLSYGRRCKSCQYLESSIANTIFDNIRFPIYKALYILYRCSREPTAKQLNLPLILVLRPGTCSLFRKKVLNQMQIKNFNPQKDEWEKLIIV